MSKDNFSAPQKFRAIDTRTGEVVECLMGLFLLRENGRLISSNWSGWKSHRRNIASASIGLKDSKGVEIFAGDILIKANDPDMERLDSSFGKIIAKWDLSRLQYKPQCLANYYIYKHQWSELTIIGNIYEPEFRKYLEALETK